MRQMKHWQDPVNALLGVWLIASPWALSFQDHPGARWTFVATGVLLLAAALGATFVPKAWEEWTEAVLGVWMIASPWVIGFADRGPAMQDALLTGLVVVILALWVLGTDKEYGGWFSRAAG